MAAKQDSVKTEHWYTISDADLEAIVNGYHGAPFSILGPQVTTYNDKECLSIRAFRPLDDAVFVVNIENGKQYPMQQIRETGLFEVIFQQRKTPFAYRVPGGRVTEPQIGGSIIRQGDKDLFTRHQVWELDPPKEEIV